MPTDSQLRLAVDSRVEIRDASHTIRATVIPGAGRPGISLLAFI